MNFLFSLCPLPHVPQKIRQNFLAWLLIAALFLSLIPLLWVGIYARAAMDDFNFSLLTHSFVQNGKNVLPAAFITAKNIYVEWQGTFSSIFLMSLSPVIFSEKLYGITTVVMLLSLILGTVKLTDTLVRRGLGGSWRETVYVSVPLLFLSIQCVPSLYENFYWWNGGIHYTFAYGMLLLYMERLSAFLLADGQPLQILIPGALAGIMVGGSNYVSAFLAVLLTGSFLAACLIWFRKKVPGCIFFFLFLAVSFIISFLAPGNAVRQSTVTPLSPAVTILVAIQRAWIDCKTCFNPFELLFLLFLVPVFWKLEKNISFSFPFPAGITIFTFLIFAAQNCPHYYAMLWDGPPRLRNIIFFSFHWLVFLNEWYWLGWLRRVLKGREMQKLFRICVPFCLAGICLIFLQNVSAYPLTGVICISELRRGTVQAHAFEADARAAALMDPMQTDPIVAPFTVYSFLTSSTEEISEDPTDWSNIGLAAFYGKNSVTKGRLS